MYDRSFIDLFSETVPEANAKFRGACRDATWTESVPHPLTGPDGEPLATEVAWFGRKDARHLVVGVSATHGVEGWAGSACQIGWARSGAGASLPDDVAVLQIHIVNPWGMAWDRRQQEDNVDLNRHYVDFDELPDDSAYRALDAHVMCDLAGPDADAASAALAAYEAEHGRRALHMALYGGQYSNPLAPSYGGLEPTWSRLLVDRLIAAYCGTAGRIVLCDFHTGYGPYGYGIPLWHLEAGPQLDKARYIFGETTEAPLAGDRAKDEFIQNGHFYQYWVRKLPGADVIPMCFEFGGEHVSDEASIVNEREDSLSWRDDDRLSAASRALRRRIRDIHCPPNDDWREMIWFRGRQLYREMIERIRLVGADG